MVDVCKAHPLVLPRRDRCGALVGQAPRVAAVLAMLTPPAAAGALTSGRTRTLRREARQVRPAITRLPQEQWRVGLPEVSPPSRSGDTSLQRQAMRTDHHAAEDRNNTRGLPRPGTALVHGLVSCGACGPKMVVP